MRDVQQISYRQQWFLWVQCRFSLELDLKASIGNSFTNSLNHSKRPIYVPTPYNQSVTWLSLLMRKLAELIWAGWLQVIWRMKHFKGNFYLCFCYLFVGMITINEICTFLFNYHRVTITLPRCLALCTDLLEVFVEQILVCSTWNSEQCKTRLSRWPSCLGWQNY